MRPRSTLLLLVALFVVSAPLFGFTIYLKDGSHFQAKGPYRVEGERAVITLPNGNQTFIAVTEIDVARTRQANADGHAGALVMETPQEPRAKGAPVRPQLSEVAADRTLGDRLPVTRPGDRPQAATESVAAGDLPRTASGSVDLMRVQRVTYHGREIGSAVSRMVRARGIEEVAIYEGTRPGRVFLEFTTNSEAAVFRALLAAAETLVELQEQGLDEVPALEVFMATDRRLRAGQFLLTPEMALELTSKQIDLPAFFVKYVQF